MACIETSRFMDSSEMGSPNLENHNLEILANRLRCYRPPSLNGEIENDGINSSMESGDARERRSSRERRAAVLICLFEDTKGELRVILTKRSMNLSSHPGEVALPGGKMEEGDEDDSATALREAMEEIGLNPSLVQVVANLEPFISQHRLVVVPVVGILTRIKDFKPALNQDEVDAIFYAPMEMFLKEDGHSCQEKEWRSWKYTQHLFDYESEQGVYPIGGLTASILIRAASIIYQRPPSFPVSFLDFQQLQRTLTNVVVS